MFGVSALAYVRFIDEEITQLYRKLEDAELKRKQDHTALTDAISALTVSLVERDTDIAQLRENIKELLELCNRTVSVVARIEDERKQEKEEAKASSIGALYNWLGDNENHGR